MNSVILGTNKYELNLYLIGFFKALKKLGFKLDIINSDETSFLASYAYFDNSLLRLTKILERKDKISLNKYMKIDKALSFNILEKDIPFKDSDIKIIIDNTFKREKGLKEKEELTIDLTLNKKRIIIKPTSFKDNLLEEGFYDTLKVINNLEGNNFYFKSNALKKNYNKYNHLFCDLISKYICKDDKELITILNKNIHFKQFFSNSFTSISEFQKLEEYLGEVFELEKYKVYSSFGYNLALKRKIKKYLKDNNPLTNVLSQGEMLEDKDIIISIYSYLKDDNLNKEVMKEFPYYFLASCYLKVIK